MKNAGFVALAILQAIAASAAASDWPSWRGPEQTGQSRENAVVTSWSPDEENLLWKVPIGGRTTPVLFDGRLFMITPVGDGECLRERVVCLDATTGETIWEHAFNVFHADIVQARLGWTAVVGDPETGNIYAHGTGGEFFCFNRDGRVLWKHSLGEEFGRYSGYGGRLHTPIIDEDRVVISYVYILSNWGTGKAKSGHRYVAFNKHTGRVDWWGQPGGKPHDTTYSVPFVTVIDGKRVLVAANADGNVYGMLARTGEPLWTFRFSKRGLNTSVVVEGNYVYATHGEENIDGTEMGRVVCIDASKTGDITESGEVWRADGLAVGYASPALANGRLYVATNSANLLCLDAKTGKKHWEFSLGRAMKGSPTVTADGVIYVGEVNGRFHILKDQGDRCELLDLEEFPLRDGAVVEINGSPIVANGRVYFQTSFDTYCLGKANAEVAQSPVPPLPPEAEPDKTRPVFLQIVPEDVTLAPGEEVTLETRLFDVNGRLIGSPAVQWSATDVRGTFGSSNTFTAGPSNLFSAGLIHAVADTLHAAARVRISPKTPIEEGFNDMKAGEIPPGWIGVDLKTALVEKDGSLVLQKLAESPSAPYMRMRAFSGPPIPTGYTVQADLFGSPKVGRNATRPDMGLINSRYKLILLDKEEALRIVSYSPIPRIQKDVPLEWKTDVWYQAKLSVDLQGDNALVRGKVWPRDEAEPEVWTIEVVDPCPNDEGSPGLYAYSKGTTAVKPGATVFFDNYRVTRND